MGTVEITGDNFRDVVEKNGIVVIDWWASWCAPCRAFAPIFEEAATRHPGITFGKVNTEQQQKLAGEFDIKGIPTLMIFRDVILLFSEAGSLSAPALEGLINQVSTLDMERVRQEIEEEKNRRN